VTLTGGGRRQDANGAKRTVYMEHKNIYGYAESYVQATDCHPMQDLAQRLKALGKENARIGLEMDNYYFLCPSLYDPSARAA
jgi:ectoine hydrolase